MVLRIRPSIARVILLMVGVYAFPCSAVAPAYALDPAACTIPMNPCLCEAGEESCVTTAPAGTLRPAALAPEEPAFEAGIPAETLSLYKTITYVTGVTLTDQLWYLAIASAAATTGGGFLAANAATTSAMVYSY